MPLQPSARGYLWRGPPPSDHPAPPLASAPWFPPTSPKPALQGLKPLHFSCATPSREALNAKSASNSHVPPGSTLRTLAVMLTAGCGSPPCQQPLNKLMASRILLNPPLHAPSPPSSPSSQKLRGGPVLPLGLPAVAGLTTTSPPQLLRPQVPRLPWSPHFHIPPTNLFSSFSLNSRLSLGLPAPVLQPASGPCPRFPAWLLQGPSGPGCHLPSHFTCHVPPHPESACTRVSLYHSHAPSRPPNLLFLLFPKILPFLSNHRALQATLLAWSHPPVASSPSQLLRAICKHNSLHRAPSVCR